MRASSLLDAILIQVALVGAVAALALLGVAVLHHTQLDTMTGGKGPLHGFGRFLAIPIVAGAFSFLLLTIRRVKRP